VSEPKPARIACLPTDTDIFPYCVVELTPALLAKLDEWRKATEPLLARADFCRVEFVSTALWTDEDVGDRVFARPVEWFVLPPDDADVIVEHSEGATVVLHAGGFAWSSSRPDAAAYCETHSITFAELDRLLAGEPALAVFGRKEGTGADVQAD